MIEAKVCEAEFLSALSIAQISVLWTKNVYICTLKNAYFIFCANLKYDSKAAYRKFITSIIVQMQVKIWEKRLPLLIVLCYRRILAG